MDRTPLKKYAPQARKDFIAAVVERAGHYGLTKKQVEPVEVKGDVALIGGRPFPRSVGIKRMGLERRIEREGFDQVMEAIAYTWFNRFVALRYMELHGYLDHGYRVLSHPEGKDTPEIVEQAQHVTLPGLHPQRVVDLKLAGNKEGELYRMLLVAQCNALHKAMPFLFERIDDETELLLPDNLLHSDSLIRKLVREIPEANWQEIEVIGWIYQFYISEKKDAVIGKVVKSEDIPAATQLFTPNWIVKYLVQNSIGRQWLATYPQSPLRQQMEYYIEPAEQTPEVQAQLDAITPDSLNPEEMTLLDPACGSGHILVEAYDLFKGIYQERGYRAKDIPRLILANNLFGLEIDDRAAQLAAFALIMKARADDRRVLEGGIRMNVRCIQSSDGLNAEEVYEALTGNDVVDKSGLPPAEEFDFSEEQTAPLLAYMRRESAKSSSSLPPDPCPLTPSSPPCPLTPAPCTLSDIRTLLGLFQGDDAKTFGSLIRIPKGVAKKLPAIVEWTDALVHGDDLGKLAVAERFAPVAEQALVLSSRFDATLANPPYMGFKQMNQSLRTYGQNTYPEGRGDLFALFIQRNAELTNQNRSLCMITMDSWMYGDGYNEFRDWFYGSLSLLSCAHLGPHAFDEISGEVVQVAVFSALVKREQSLICDYRRLVRERNSSEKEAGLLEGRNRYLRSLRQFIDVPRRILAYHASENVLTIFREGAPLKDVAEAFTGLQTGDNEQFIRYWYEVRSDSIEFNATCREAAGDSDRRWFPYVKGSDYRRWFGNNLCVVDWKNDGKSIRTHPSATVRNDTFYFRAGLAYNNISKHFCVRLVDHGFIFDQKNSMFFPARSENIRLALSFLNSRVIIPFLDVLSPKDFNPGSLKVVPVKETRVDGETMNEIVDELVTLSRRDWNELELSWDFSQSCFLAHKHTDGLLNSAYAVYCDRKEKELERTRELEQQNNEIWVRSYSLNAEVSTAVGDDEVTLFRPNELTDMAALLSYAVGCMMGRYSLDEPGLIYAHSGNEGFDPSRYATFPADEDGVIPLTDYAWFDDDATNRFVEFISIAWPKEHLEENLQFVAESLGPKRGEDARDTIRRYFAMGFFKDHLQTYKKRPIYWLFTSGKQRAFQCLVYLHRYNEGTLSRIRTQYVIPLMGKMQANLDHLETEIAHANSTKHERQLRREYDALRDKLAELRPIERFHEKDEERPKAGMTFDDRLNHYAAQRITLDLDDGVKVNYGKFGDLLAEVKAVTGEKAEG